MSIDKSSESHVATMEVLKESIYLLSVVEVTQNIEVLAQLVLIKRERSTALSNVGSDCLTPTIGGMIDL